MKPYRKPDLNAPRFRKKKTTTLNAEFYKWLRDKHPELKDVPDNLIKEIVLTFNKEQYETIIRVRDGVELLAQMGYIFIGSCKRKVRDNPDAQKSQELGQKVQHQNFESNQWLAKIFYTNYETSFTDLSEVSRRTFRNHDLWHMDREFCREFKRAVARSYPERYKQYVIIDNIRYISKLFRKRNYKHYRKKDEQEILKNYNEFDLD